jgi:predicted metal-dependent enzyme (double-stranded beta helix superfamily)
LLGYLKRTLEREAINNVLPRRVPPTDPNLPAAGADLVFLCNTYHQLPDRVAYLKKLATGLKGDGRIAVIDFHKREDVPEGPPFREKLRREAVIEEFRRAGFQLSEEQSFLPYQYFLVFRPARVYSFDTFARAISMVMASPEPDGRKQDAVAALLSDYLGKRTLEEQFQRSLPGLPVTTYLLHADPRGAFSIAALVFRPRARTPIHDHQSWVVWGTYSGAERETRFRRRSAPSRSFPELTPAWRRVFSAGEISFIDPPPGDIHAVENVGEGVSVSLHVHATDISRQVRNSYDVETKTVRSFVQSYEPAM